MRADQNTDRTGQIAVIFRSQRNADDEPGYAAATVAMDMLAARRPGYRGIESVRDAAGHGVTVSYWSDDAAAIAWRDHPDHAAIRAQGRGRWYESYEVAVAAVERSYRWTRG